MAGSKVNTLFWQNGIRRRPSGTCKKLEQILGFPIAMDPPAAFLLFHLFPALFRILVQTWFLILITQAVVYHIHIFWAQFCFIFVFFWALPWFFLLTRLAPTHKRKMRLDAALPVQIQFSIVLNSILFGQYVILLDSV